MNEKLLDNKGENVHNCNINTRRAGRLGGEACDANRMETQPKYRTSFYVDCFNLYHPIKSLLPEAKWTSIYNLLIQFLGVQDELVAIKLFTAEPNHISAEQTVRHQIFETVQLHQHDCVKVIKGNFKKKEVKCKSCKEKFIAHEEKQTDVNLATHILSDVYHKVVDKVIILSTDTDFVPIINQLAIDKIVNKIELIAPPAKKKIPYELITSIQKFYGIKNRHNKQDSKISTLKKSHFDKNTRLPDEIKIDNKIYKNPYKPELHEGECECVLHKKPEK